MLVIMALVTTMMASPLLPLLGYKQKRQPQETTGQLPEIEPEAAEPEISP
jgi:hypothetical protein